MTRPESHPSLVTFAAFVAVITVAVVLDIIFTDSPPSNFDGNRNQVAKALMVGPTVRTSHRAGSGVATAHPRAVATPPQNVPSGVPTHLPRSRTHSAQHRSPGGRSVDSGKAGVPSGERSALAAWLASPTAVAVVWRESRGECHVVNPKGPWMGKWQMDADFWATYGGLVYATRPDLATCHQQDVVAYTGYLARGWEPWS